MHSFVSVAHFLQFAPGQFGSGGGSTSAQTLPLPDPPLPVAPLFPPAPEVATPLPLVTSPDPPLVVVAPLPEVAALPVLAPLVALVSPDPVLVVEPPKAPPTPPGSSCSL